MKHGGKRVNAGRPKGQGKYGTSTKAIRVPEYLIEDVRNYSINGGYKIPFFSSKVEAGCPSFADDHIEDMIDMNHFLIKNPFIFEILSFSFTFSAFSQKSISLIILMHSYSYFNALAIISASYKAARAKEYSFLIL